MPKERLFNALLSAFELDAPGDPNNDEQARAITDIVAACASVFAPPPASVEGIELQADDTLALILDELRGLRADIDAIQVGGALRVTD